MKHTHTQQFECVWPSVDNVHPLTSLSPLYPCQTENIARLGWTNLHLLKTFLDTGHQAAKTPYTLRQHLVF